MKIFLFSTALSDEVYQRITGRCSRFKPTFSGVGFDRNVAMGLAAHADVVCISYYPIPSYPKYRAVWEPASCFSLGNLNACAPAMLDLPVIKEISYCFDAVRRVKKSGAEDAVILVSGLYRCLLRPARILKKILGIKVYAIVPDVPEVMHTYRRDYSPLRRFLNRLDVNNSRKYRDCVDGYVLLSRHMNEIVNPDSKPWIQVEGMCDISREFPKETVQDKEAYLLYAGKISKKFGADRLIRGFRMANLPDCSLYLCGDGDLADEVRRAAEEDPRIRYLGLIPHARVMELERGAALLVEPRPTDDIMSKMSFPSKILEYMASGTPVLTTSLPCFSDEYRDFQFRIDDESDEGICSALQKIMGMDPDTRKEMGRRAKEFVTEHKNVGIQCRRIIAFIKGENG